MSNQHIIQLIVCKCGCGELITETDSYGRKHYYKHGHNRQGRHHSVETKERIIKSNMGKHFDRIGKSAIWKIKDKVKVRTSRERAVKILIKEGRYNQCVINLDCKGKLEAHHLDKNPFNNDPKNLVCLCRGHHKLADLHTLNIDELKTVKYIVKNGRRYTKYNKQLADKYTYTFDCSDM